MAFFDVFNGDADGICALHMLRLARPRAAELVTGVKREIDLLRRVAAGAGDAVTVLDISLDQNREALLGLLERGAAVEYFDHHFAGEIPRHEHLTSHIDTAPATCTSLLVNRFLDGRYASWAVVAAFGDNMAESAREAGRDLCLADDEFAALQSLGECLNYNGYGESIDDLFFHPAQLYRIVHGYDNPFDMLREAPAYRVLREGYDEDMARADAVVPLDVRPGGAIFGLPDAAWSRRISGVFGNALAQRSPRRAHAVLTRKITGTWLVSVRAPLATRTGADDLCRRFATGGGRQAAAGINDLPDHEVDRFIAAFHGVFAAG